MKVIIFFLSKMKSLADITLGHCHTAGTNNQGAFDLNMGTGGKVLQTFFGQVSRLQSHDFPLKNDAPVS